MAMRIIANEFTERYIANDKLRMKVTNKCNMNCWFCHAEGSPNSQDITLDDTLYHSLGTLREVFNKVHITGGEPFEYNYLNEFLERTSPLGYSFSITSNGLFEINYPNLRVLEKLSYINISFHSMEPLYYSKLSGSNDGSYFVDKIIDNIYTLSKILPVRINCVVSGTGEEQRLRDLVKFAGEIGCELKFVPELRTKISAIGAIEDVLKEDNFALFERIYISPSSNVRERYKDSCGNIIEVKKLIPCFPDCICKDCKALAQCEEGFSFLRLGGTPLSYQVCIKQKPINHSIFIDKTWPKLKEMFQNEKNFHCK